jgi:hypothetical protein
MPVVVVVRHSSASLLPVSSSLHCVIVDARAGGVRMGEFQSIGTTDVAMRGVVVTAACDGAWSCGCNGAHARMSLVSCCIVVCVDEDTAVSGASSVLLSLEPWRCRAELAGVSAASALPASSLVAAQRQRLWHVGSTWRWSLLFESLV